ncbi:hypothetical protein, partial [Bacillus mycoides]|uniref:hypothetical protein n=1 Tax=Bacillus mycoides TaxID=1405 RepID=UPI0011AA0AA7
MWVCKVGERERNKLLNVESILDERVIGEDEGVVGVGKGVGGGGGGLKDGKGGIGRFILLGWSRVGTTEL